MSNVFGYIPGNDTGSATTIALTPDDTLGQYFIPFSKTTKKKGNKLYIDNSNTPLTYDPSTGTLTATAFAGTVAATNISLSQTATTSSNYLIMSTTPSGLSTLRTTVSGATYNALNNTADLNVSGNAGSANTATNQSGGSVTATTGSFSGSVGITGNLTMGNSSILNVSTIQATTFTGTLDGTASKANQVLSKENSANAVRYLTFTDTNSAAGTFVDILTKSTIQCNPSTGTITAPAFSGPLTGNASSATKVAVTANLSTSLSYPVLTQSTGASVDLSIDTTGSQMTYDPPSGTLSTAIFSGSGSLSTLSVSSTSTFSDTASINITASGSSKSGLVIKDTTSNDYITVIPNNTSGTFNGIVQVGDSSIVATTVGASGAQTVCLTVESNTKTGVRVAPTTTMIGAGGTGGTVPTSSLLFSGTEATLTGNLALGSNSITSANSITSTTFVGSLTGVASQINVSQSNTSGIRYPVFVQNVGTQDLLIDNVGSLMTYDAPNGTLSMVGSRVSGTARNNVLTVGDINNSTPPANSTTMQHSAANVQIINNGGDGITEFYNYNTTVPFPAQRKVLTLSYNGVNSDLPQPLSSNSSTLVPTTAWVQGAITAGTSAVATTVTITPDSTSGTFYPTFASSGGGAQTLKYNTTGPTSFSYVPSTGNLQIYGVNIGKGASTTGYNLMMGESVPSTINFTTGGGRNTMYGNFSGSSLAAGSYWNTLIGDSAGASNTTGVANTYVGYLAGASTGGVVGTGNNNVCVGMYCGTALSSGGSNTMVGFGAGTGQSSGYNNTSLGYYAGAGTTSGFNNVFVGFAAGYQSVASGGGNSNVCVGVEAGTSMTNGSENTLVGLSAGRSITSGVGNTVMGKNAGIGLTTAVNNTYIGNECGTKNGAGQGSYNTAYGTLALQNIGAGQQNVAIGYEAGIGCVGGNNNIFLGFRAGNSPGSGVSAYGGSNSIFIGARNIGVFANTNNIIQIGENGSQTLILRVQVNLNVYGLTLQNSTTIFAPLLQLYMVQPAAANQTFTLPDPGDPIHSGAIMTFKRIGNLVQFFFACSSVYTTTPFLLITNTTPQASPMTVGTAVHVVTLMSNNRQWCVINQA